MALIIGIDPGLVNIGWGIIWAEKNQLKFIACGTIITKSTSSITDRLAKIHHELTLIIEQYKPNQCAIEETFVNKNPATSLKLGQARGAIILSLALSNLPITEYAATLIKKSVVGKGRADKNQVESLVKYILPKAIINSEHEADALATAICHSSFIRNKL